MTNDRSLTAGDPAGPSVSDALQSSFASKLGFKGTLVLPHNAISVLILLKLCSLHAQHGQDRGNTGTSAAEDCAPTVWQWVWTEPRDIAINSTAASNTLRHCVQIKQIYGPHYPLSYETQPWRMLISNSINNRNTFHIGMQASAHSDALFVHKSQGRIPSLCVRERMDVSHFPVSVTVKRL